MDATMPLCSYGASCPIAALPSEQTELVRNCGFGLPVAVIRSPVANAIGSLSGYQSHHQSCQIVGLLPWRRLGIVL